MSPSSESKNYETNSKHSATFYSFHYYYSHGVRLSPLGTAATVWPIIPAPDDRWWLWSNRWSVNWQGKPKHSDKTCSSATLSTINPTWPHSGSKPDRRGGKAATNRLYYDTVLHSTCLFSLFTSSLALKMEAILSSETSMNCLSTRHRT
jgi:hypothetical protein